MNPRMDPDPAPSPFVQAMTAALAAGDTAEMQRLLCALARQDTPPAFDPKRAAANDRE